MRYKIGDTIWTVFMHNRKTMFYPAFSRFTPWRDDVLRPVEDGAEVYPRLVFKKLIVTEHHKVRSEWQEATEEADCDGYVLNDDDGMVWHNQYPTAHYGQISDSCDGLFSLDINKTHKDVGRQLMAYIDIKREPNSPDFEGLYETYDLIREMKHMRRSVEEFQGNARVGFSDKREVCEKEANMLGRWQAHIIAEFEKATGLFVSSRPHMYGSTKDDGVMQHLPGWYDYEISATKLVSTAQVITA